MNSMPKVGTRIFMLPDDDSKSVYRALVTIVSEDGKSGKIRKSGKSNQTIETHASKIFEQDSEF